MKHIMFIRPYSWQDKISDLEFGEKKIHCLLCIPISDKELEYKQKNGQERLEYILFEENEIDIYDINRKSVI